MKRVLFGIAVVCSVLFVITISVALFSIGGCTPPKNQATNNWAKSLPSAVGTATEDARILAIGNNLVACKFLLRVPPYGLVEFEPNPYGGGFTNTARSTCALVRKGDRMKVVVTSYFRNNDKGPYKIGFETKGVYGELSPTGL